ncbi:hypothetical protein Tco_0943239 [Tanacetum coccineum]
MVAMVIKNEEAIRDVEYLKIVKNDDDDDIARFSVHIPPYQPVRSALLTRDHLPDVKDTYTIVSIEKAYRGVHDSSSVTKSKMNATSFAAKSYL